MDDHFKIFCALFCHAYGMHDTQLYDSNLHLVSPNLLCITIMILVNLNRNTVISEKRNITIISHSFENFAFALGAQDINSYLHAFGRKCFLNLKNKNALFSLY